MIPQEARGQEGLYMYLEDKCHILNYTILLLLLLLLLLFSY